MISLVTSSAKPPLSPQAEESNPTVRENSAEKGGFSAVFEEFAEEPSPVGPQKASVAPKTELTQANAAEPATDASLPDADGLQTAKGGKILPHQLQDIAGAAGPSTEVVAEPDAAAPRQPDTAPLEPQENEGSIEALAEEVDPDTVARAGWIAQIGSNAAADAEVERPSASGAAAKPARGPDQPIHTGSTGADKAAQAQPPHAGAGKAAEGTTVVLDVASQPHAAAKDNLREGARSRAGTAEPPQPNIRSESAGVAEGSLAKVVSAEARIQAPMDAAAPVVQGPSSGSAPAAEGGFKPPLQVQALQDLTRIVEHLAAAREVFAPASAALAINHAEFGELSLRFEQQREGHLAVQLSAGDPEAHRAVAAAVGDRPFMGTAENPSGNSNANAQSQGQPRSAAAGRDGETGSGNTARDERSQQRSPAPSTGESDEAGRRRAGIFA